MKKLLALILAALMLLSLAACSQSEPAAATAKPEPVAEPAPTAEPTAKPEPTAEPTPEPTPEPMPEPTPEPISPYAWLGYAELPQNNYFDIMATGIFYREYDSYISGYSVPSVQASDGVNTYAFDGSTISLNLRGMVYSLGVRIKQYMQRDMTEVYQSTLAQQNENRINGVDITGKEFVGTGSEPVPLLSDTASYDYYEFFTDQSAGGTTLTMRERIYFKDGDVYAINQLVTIGENTSELTDVIKTVSASPDPSLFALPADFDQYSPLN